MNYKALEVFYFFLEHYKVNPVADLEFKFEPSGSDDQSKRKSSLSFVKRIGVLTPSFNELYEVQNRFMTDLREMNVVYKIGFNYNAFNVLAPLYARYEKNVKEFRRLLKKYSSFNEVTEYYKKADNMLPDNVYETMKEDFSLFNDVTTKRLSEIKLCYPNWQVWDSEHPNWETINQLYKNAKK
ncbi:hypothetical protein RVBP17_3630 [Pseudomonas phage sp. 30-3]|nr:hypothetical protein GBBBJNDB_00319 [Pseudomonas phage Callisto]BDR25592.1 hypothetical protein RVBP16_0320 [Pseudomonas phage sp. 30-2]BDR26320.1 hypothetical protein RVBP17_3630 [Pseudomonas phage sp. 30-3]